jgi:hypothetical protein
LLRNCLLKHFIAEKIEGRIQVRERGGRRRKLILDELKEMRGYWKLKEGSTRPLSVESSICKSLWTCRKRD